MKEVYGPTLRNSANITIPANSTPRKRYSPILYLANLLNN